MGWDLVLIRGVADHRTGWLTDVAWVVMVVGQNRLSYLGAALLGLAIAWRLHGWWHLGASAAGTVAAIGLAALGKALVARPRPPYELALVHAQGYGMPSDIAAMTAAAALPLVVLGWRSGSHSGRLVAGALVAATFVGGVSTVYLGAHWLTDVLAGWALGALTGAAALTAVQGLRRLRRRRAGWDG